MSYREIIVVYRLQLDIVKRILGLHMRTRSYMCESMTCCNKLYSNVVIRKLMFLHKILSLDVYSTTRNIFVKHYMLYTSDKTLKLGFIPDICKVLCIYGLQTFINNVLICQTSLPSQLEWKRRVKYLVLTNEQYSWRDRIINDEDFHMFRTLLPSIAPSVVFKIFDKNMTFVQTHSFKNCKTLDKTTKKRTRNMCKLRTMCL